jgi:hypothetical protein
MKRPLAATMLLTLAGIAHAQSSNCSILAPSALPVQPTVVPAIAPEFTAPSHQLGAPTGVLAQAYDESQSIENVLFRIKLEGCKPLADALPAAKPADGVIDPATYKPQTQFDNTPWRFDMNQNGKRMTAEEFDQWMKARGVRVARGSGAPAATPASTTAPSTTQPAPAPAEPPKKP